MTEQPGGQAAVPVDARAPCTAPRLNIMVVEDHDALREVTVDVLRAQGHHVTGVDSADALDEQWGILPMDLLVLDLNLPGEDGLSIAQRIRKVQPDIGIIMVTARTHISEKVAGYEGGADVYLTKPTSLDELNAAIAAMARRLKKSVPTEICLRLDLHRLTVAGPHATVSLSKTEATLMANLSRANGQRLESWQLIEGLKKDVAQYNKASLEVCIVRLRKKLSATGVDSPAIKSIRDFGYQLCVTVEIAV